MKLLFVFTGGTIGSTFNGGYISTDKNKPYTLINMYMENFEFNDSYDIIEPYTALSENNSGKTIKMLVKSVLQNLGKAYDGIIVTHGTDTIQYSSAALAYAVGNTSIPICLVSSNYPVEDCRANAIYNLHSAVKFIREQKQNGVWVPYKNPNEPIKIHRASRLLAGQAFSSRLDSILDSHFGYYDNNFIFHKNCNFYESADEITPMNIEGLADSCDNILRVLPYPGMVYHELNDKIKYVICESYHSGTINTKSSETLRFLESAAEREIEVFLTGISNEKAYESTKALKKYNIHPLFNSAPIAMFMKLWIASSSGTDPKLIMNKSLAGDISANGALRCQG